MKTSMTSLTGDALVSALSQAHARVARLQLSVRKYRRALRGAEQELREARRDVRKAEAALAGELYGGQQPALPDDEAAAGGEEDRG